MVGRSSAALVPAGDPWLANDEEAQRVGVSQSGVDLGKDPLAADEVADTVGEQGEKSTPTRDIYLPVKLVSSSRLEMDKVQDR
jgi:hypothetical protein